MVILALKVAVFFPYLIMHFLSILSHRLLKVNLLADHNSASPSQVLIFIKLISKLQYYNWRTLDEVPFNFSRFNNIITISAVLIWIDVNRRWVPEIFENQIMQRYVRGAVR